MRHPEVTDSGSRGWRGCGWSRLLVRSNDLEVEVEMTTPQAREGLNGNALSGHYLAFSLRFRATHNSDVEVGIFVQSLIEDSSGLHCVAG